MAVLMKKKLIAKFTQIPRSEEFKPLDLSKLTTAIGTLFNDSRTYFFIWHSSVKAISINNNAVGFFTLSSELFRIRELYFYSAHFRPNPTQIYHIFGIIVLNIEYVYIFFVIVQGRARLQKMLNLSNYLLKSWPGKFTKAQIIPVDSRSKSCRI